MFDNTMLVDDEGTVPADDEYRVWRYELPGGDGTVHRYRGRYHQFATKGERHGWRALPGDARGGQHDAQH
jgi:hypothetical protein